VVARCKDCHTQWTVTEPVFTCQACRSGAIDILSGRELDITSIEIEDED
jgi:hydrogenase nickel incorporation protein HypA/HybF